VVDGPICLAEQCIGVATAHTLAALGLLALGGAGYAFARGRP